MIDRAVRDAARRREGLAEGAYRLAHEGELPARATVDVYAGFAVLAVPEDAPTGVVDEISLELTKLDVRGVYLKRRPRVASRASANLAALAPPGPIHGEHAPDPLVIEERGARYRVRLGAGLSTGLFLDQRENRARVRALARGARVLNLFSYTCSFSVAAALGGATRVTSVDVSGEALAVGEANFVENGLDPAAHRFKREDATVALARAKIRGDRWDIIVLDPPSFASKRGAAHDVARDLAGLLDAARAVLAERGTVFVSTNHRGTSAATLRGIARRAFPDARLDEPTLPSDFPSAPGEAPFVKTVVITRR